MSRHAHSHAAVAPAEVLDPVCGMTISPEDAVGNIDYKGQTYYFCSQGCLDRFRATPEAFLGKRPAATPLRPADMERDYTCPMDPEVRQTLVVAERLALPTLAVERIPRTLVFWTVWAASAVSLLLSGGLRCAPSLFRPTDMPGVLAPCVVMAHGFTGPRDQLTLYAGLPRTMGPPTAAVRSTEWVGDFRRLESTT